MAAGILLEAPVGLCLRRPLAGAQGEERPHQCGEFPVEVAAAELLLQWPQMPGADLCLQFFVLIHEPEIPDQVAGRERQAGIVH